MEKKRLYILKRTLDAAKSDIGLTLTIAYVILICLGILFNYHYYEYYRVDVFAFSDITDCLIAPIRRPLILIFFIGTIVFFIAMMELDDWLMEHRPAWHRKFSFGMNPDGKNRERLGMFMFFLIPIFYSNFFIEIYVNNVVKKNKSEKAQKIEVVLKTANEGQQTKQFTWIGKIGEVIVVKEDTSKRKAIVIPMEEVHSVVFIPKQEL
ncbi:MAG TPA: hypothetical protein PK509_12955 [Catalimonadaceae bacterium]|nr:hypothetical protein [Catalimonadaceae bacterium]HPI12895.1 hypothetical protein [Catalimonadaceae bacterium]